MASKACVNRLQKEYKGFLKVQRELQQAEATVVASANITLFNHDCRILRQTYKLTLHQIISLSGTMHLREPKELSMRVGCTTAK